RENGAVGAAIVDIHVAGAAVENAGHGQTVTDVLHIGRFGADDHAALRLLVEAERGDVRLGAEEDRGLRGGRGARQSGRIAPQLPAVALDEAAKAWGVAAIDGADQVLVGERVDLDDDEAALIAFEPAAALAGERKVLETVIEAIK